MRILSVSTLHPSGVELDRATWNWQQLRVLARMSDLAVVAPVPWSPPASPRPDWTRFRRIPRREFRDGIEILHPRYLVIPKTGRWIQGWSYAIQLRRALTDLAPRFQPDVILATWAYPDIYSATRVGADRGVPVVGKVVGSDLNLLPADGLERQVRAALQWADRVVAVGEDLRRRAVELGAAPDRTVVVPNGVDDIRFSPRDRRWARDTLGIAGDEKLILYVGNLKPEKQPGLLVDAFARVREARDDVSLVLVGAGPLAADVRRRIEVLGVGDRVTLAGQRPHHEIPTWLNAADVLALPSSSEGVPNVVLEAVASGTPVVATRVGGVSEALVDGAAGLTVEPGSALALARGILDVLRDSSPPDRVRASSQAGTWEESAARLAAVLEEVVAQRSSRPKLPRTALRAERAREWS